MTRGYGTRVWAVTAYQGGCGTLLAMQLFLTDSGSMHGYLRTLRGAS